MFVQKHSFLSAVSEHDASLEFPQLEVPVAKKMCFLVHLRNHHLRECIGLSSSGHLLKPTRTENKYSLLLLETKITQFHNYVNAVDYLKYIAN